MYNHYKKSLLSLALALALLCGLAPVHAFELAPLQNDPLSAMTDIMIRNPHVSAQNAENSADNILSGTGETAWKTDRYLVKYRPNRAQSFKTKLNRTDMSLSFGAVMDASPVLELDATPESALELIVLDEKMTPSEFADELRDLGILGDIEYVQPDFELSLDALDEFTLELQEPPAEPEPSPETSPEPSPEPTPEPEMLPETVPEPSPEPEPLPEPVNASPVLVALIDTGVDINHEQLEGFIDAENAWDFPGESNEVYDSARTMEAIHGTHIAGIIASSAQETGADVTILPLKVFNKGRAYTSDVIAAIEYANDCGASVINCSFGSSSDNPALREAIENSPALFVCAVGNNRRNLDEAPSFPACFDLPNIISVGSVNADGGFSYFSSYGAESVDITALGRDVLSLYPNDDTGIMNGTSMSAGFVSGTASATASLNPALDTAALRERLLSCSDRLENLQDKVIDGRRLNLSSVLAGSPQNEILDVYPEDDFDPTGYNPSESELLELYSNGTQVVQVAAGGRHTLVLKDDGTVWAWGDNSFGQLGNGTNVSSTTPVEVIGLRGIFIEQIQAGENHSLALDDIGNVYSWGDNTYGQLGNVLYSRNFPSIIYEIGNIKKISTKYNHNLAIASRNKNYDSMVWEWGRTTYCIYDQYEIYEEYLTPHVYSTYYEYEDAVDIAAGFDRSIVVTPDGEGFFDTGKAVLMNERRWYGYVEDSLYASEQSFGSQTSSVFTGFLEYDDDDHGQPKSVSFAVDSEGLLWKWGYADIKLYDYNIQSGEPDSPNEIACRATTPYQIEGIENVCTVSVQDPYGGNNTSSTVYILKENGTVWKLNDDDTVTQVQNLSNIVQISSNMGYTLALKSDGTVYGWGINTQALAYALTPGDTLPGAQTLNLSVTAGKTYTVSVIGKNVATFAGKTVRVTYNNAQLEAPEVFKSPGVTAEIIALGTVTFTFTVSKTIPTGKMWSGAIGVLRFKAKTTGTAEIIVQAVQL